MSRHALAHKQRTLAALVESAGAAERATRTPANANAYELMLATLDEHRRRLKNVQSIERKLDVKRQILPEYAAWVEGVLAGNSGTQDDVLVTVMLWHIDVGDFEAAMPLAHYVISHKLAMPDRFERSAACVIAEEMADTVLKLMGDALVPYADLLRQCELLVAEQDMPDEVRAKLMKASAYTLIAMAAQERTEPDPAFDLNCRQTALDYLKRALQLHDKAGVKKDIERLERDIKNTAGSPPA